MAERRSPFLSKTDHPLKRVRFIPVKDGDLLELGGTAVPGATIPTSGYPEQFMARYPHTVIGFKPGTGPRAFGWLVVLVNDHFTSSQPVKRREKRLRSVG
jgi:hypothetical protein